MPTYTCDKCARVFKQKSGFNDHINKKNDCSTNVVLNVVVDAKIAAAKRELMIQLNPHSELVLPDDTTEKEAVLQKFFEDLHNLLWNRAGLNPEKALEHMTFFFAYRLIETQKDILGLPDECKWSYIAGKNNENDVFEAIKTGVASFRSNQKTKPFFKYHEIQKADIVFEIVRQINRIPLKALQESDTLGNIFEYMLGRGMSTMSDEGQYFTNRTICKLAFKLAYAIKKKLRRADGSLCTFADWFCGTGGFPAEYVKGVNSNLKDVNWKKESGVIHCQDMNVSSVTTTLLNMLILTGIPFQPEKIRSSNSFLDPITLGTGCHFPRLKVDYCFMNPPYGGDKSKGKDYKFAYSKKVKAEDGSTSKKFFVNADIQSIGIEDDDKVSAGVQLAMATLSADGGVCCIVLPQGFFFGASKKSIELRKKIAEDYKIWYVVDIASGSFINTSTKTSMIVFQKGVGATEKVSFIGIDEKELVSATLEELKAKSYSLNYKQYMPQTAVEVEGFEIVKLGDLISIHVGKFSTTYSKENPGMYPYYSSKTNQPDGTCKDYSFDENEYIILIKNGGSGPGIYSDSVGLGKVFHVTGKSASSSNNYMLKPKTDNINIKYLYYYLKSNKNRIMDMAEYTTGMGAITQASLLNLQIPLPSLERQQQIVEAIDGWTNLVQNEETSLKVLEKQIMFQVKEMGYGQTRAKLSEVCEVRNGKGLTKEDLIDGDVPVIGGGVSPMGYHNVHNKEAYAVVVAQVGANAGNVSRYSVKSWITNNGMTIHPKGTGIANDDVLYYLLKNIQDDIKGFAEGTAQPKLSSSSVLSLEIQIPPLNDQQTLQPEFDEIRHKHVKIASYKTKAHEAIQRLIPSAST